MAAESCYLGIDLGAESGRVMAGLWNGREMRLEEVHRFANGGVSIGGTLRWDLLRLWSEIQSGLAAAARKYGHSIVSIGVDTWGLDFALLSKSDELLGLPWHYRDPRTRGLIDQACRTVPREEIFAESGIQFMEINSLYQLLALQRDHPEILEQARHLLLIPDFLNWCLCGSRVVEFTNATTTQFYHPTESRWSTGLLQRLGLPTAMLPEVVAPGTRLGGLRTDVAQRAGLGQVEVIAPATHDTGSAVVAVPTQHTGRTNWAYLSSGTWSLLGLEVPSAILSAKALEYNVTNEGGVDGTYRLLKNIMGLWILQQCRRAFEASGGISDYSQLVRAAETARPFLFLIDPDDPRFLNPADMPEAIRAVCRETGQPVPQSEGELVRGVLESLALKYAVVLRRLEEIAGFAVETIHVVGGGARNALLNQFTADACGCRVAAGPVEATVLGNLLLQARSRGELASLGQIRDASHAIGGLEVYEPHRDAGWDAAAARFAALLASVH